MTPDELRALCERAARDKPAIWVDGWEELMAVMPSVADQIEAKDAEIKRLREHILHQYGKRALNDAYKETADG